MSRFLEIQKQIYDGPSTIAPRNPALFKRVVHRIKQLLRRYGRGGRLLDVGGYDGVMSQGFDAVVLDISRHGLDLARSRGLDTCRGDFHHVPFADSTFDTILICHALEHSSQPLEVLREVERLTKPGGQVVILVPNAAALGQLVQLVRGEVKPAGNRPSEPPEHYGQYTLQNMKGLLAQVRDFEAVQICGDSVWIPFMNRFRLYPLTTWLGWFLPRLSDSLIVVLRNKKEDISARKALAEFEKVQ